MRRVRTDYRLFENLQSCRGRVLWLFFFHDPRLSDIFSLSLHDALPISLILGYSRVPFAAARDGQFFAVFGRLHPQKRFPHVSLLTIGAVTLPFCFFSLGQLVSWLLQVQILLQFVWQCAAVILLRRYRPDIAKPFRMWLYPIPAVVSLAMWLYIFLSAP